MILGRYIGYPILTDARDLMSRAFDYLKVKIPGWEPSEGQLDVAIIEANAIEAADIATLVSQVPKAIFRYFGATIFGILPEDAAPAYVYSTWFFTDVLPHTIVAGTQVGIRDTAGNLWPFTVYTDVDVAGGVGQTAAGRVFLVAAIPGANSSTLGVVGGPVEIMDTLPWVDHITQTATTSGGVDAESDDAYLTRLALELQIMSPRPIRAIDFAILSRNVATVQRAAVLDGYNPVDGTFNNERMVTVVPADSSGQPIAAGTKTALAAYLEGMREIGFIVNILDPSYNRVVVNATILALAGYSETDVDARATNAIGTFLHPSNWGVAPIGDNPNNPITWNNETTINYLDLASAIKDVAGVDKITALTLGLFGGAQVAGDLVLNGIVPLPFTNPGDVNVVVVSA